MTTFSNNEWALVLGGSSGFGLAVAKKLSSVGMSVCVVHRDRKGAMDKIEKEFDEIRSHSNPFVSFNLDALSLEGRTSVLNQLEELMKTNGKVKLCLHSIAFGNLKPLVLSKSSDSQDEALIDEEDMARTIYSMGTSLLSWCQSLLKRRMFSEDARVLGLTSEGSSVAWKGYAAISAAKAALEAVCRSIAVEFAPYGVRCNILQPGVTNTPALRLIPGYKKIMDQSLKRNPYQRLTEPSDVASVVYLMSLPEAHWINGTVIRVDGGESISGGLNEN